MLELHLIILKYQRPSHQPSAARLTLEVEHMYSGLAISVDCEFDALQVHIPKLHRPYHRQGLQLPCGVLHLRFRERSRRIGSHMLLAINHLQKGGAKPD